MRGREMGLGSTCGESTRSSSRGGVGRREDAARPLAVSVCCVIYVAVRADPHVCRHLDISRNHFSQGKEHPRARRVLLPDDL
ncbi:hypothetical protein AB1N83_011411 [Pleurotus pulmonarius]